MTDRIRAYIPFIKPMKRPTCIPPSLRALSLMALVSTAALTASAANEGNQAQTPATPAAMFPLSSVRLLDGPFARAVAANREYLLALDPDRLLAPFLREVADEYRRSRCANVTNLPRAKGNASKVARQPRPVLAAVSGSTSARDEMETTSLIAAFIAQRARLADVAAIKKPDARERNPLIDQPLNQTLEDDVRRSLLGKRERYLLQRLHVHGGDNADFMDGTTEAFETAVRAHTRHGTTTIVPTSTVARHEQTLAFLRNTRELKRRGARPPLGLGRVAGAHLYGPYFNEDKVGCHPKDPARPPTPDEYEQYLEFADVMLTATCAPELPGAADFYRAAASKGVRLNAGHSNATWSEMAAAHALGLRHVDHLYCAMSSVSSLRERCGTPMQASMLEFVLDRLDEATLAPLGEDLGRLRLRYAPFDWRPAAR